MCGILGLINKDNISNSIRIDFENALKSLTHRGPDNQDIYANKNIIIGHTRLSILNLDSSANQPFISKKKDIVLTFNGEIYNYEELRKELNYTFITKNSDTETLLACYEIWGIEKTLQKINGMFAFVIHDFKKNETHLVRDRLGKKPLYYTLHEDSLFFSSEIKSLLKFNQIQKKINEESIYHYLTFLTVNAPNTFYQNIFKIEAGCHLTFKNNTISKNFYWDIAKFINKKNLLKDDIVKKTFEKKLLNSFKLRNISDVPISIALSGGIDSSLNLIISNKLNTNNVSAITIESESSNLNNEAEYAKELCQKLNIKHSTKKINAEEFFNYFETFTTIHKDTPCSDPNYVLMYVISSILKENNQKVLLVGEGGDELGGYPVYTKLLKEKKIIDLIPKAFYPMLKFFPLKKPFDFFVKKTLISRRHVHCFTETEKKNFWKKSQSYNSYEILKKYMDEITIKTNDSFLKKVLNVEYKLRLPELILARIDYPTMAASVEARSPFMDYNLIEFAASLPFDLKMKSKPKYLLMHFAKKYLDYSILKRKKIGFGMLLEEILNEHVPKQFEKDIQNPKAPILDYIKVSYLKKIIKSHKKNKKYGYNIWTLYALNKWLKINE
jgi:asparagine synthase (glutamine-hydrolysing)